MFSIFWHLHNLFPPQQKLITDKTGAKCKRKYSISDSQSSFALIAENNRELELKLELLKLHNNNIQPLLLVIGQVHCVQQIYIYFDGIRFPILKVLTAVDLLYKTFFVFNLEFPNESIIFYNFLQCFFYEMKSDKKFPKVSMIKDEILNLKLT